MTSVEQVFMNSHAQMLPFIQARKEPSCYEWMLHTNAHTFYPDYFKVSNVGSTAVVRCLNMVSKRLQTFGPSNTVVTRLLDVFYDIYAQYLSQETDACTHHFLESKSTILTMLMRPKYGVTSWCMVELVMLVESIMRDLMVIFNLPKMDMIHMKHMLNETIFNAYDQLKIGSQSFTKATLSSAIHASVMGNWLDVLVDQMTDKLPLVIQSMSQLKHPIDLGDCDDIFNFLSNSPRHILYECDNAGEMILDFALIDLLIAHGHRCTIVAKCAEILNDVTVSDVTHYIEKGVFKHLYNAYSKGDVSIIAANHQPVVGKYLPLISDAYRDSYQASDIVWLKGQGNFQTMPLMNHGVRRHMNRYKKPIFIGFIVKAPIVQYCLQQVLGRSVAIGSPFKALV